MEAISPVLYKTVIAEIAALPWQSLSRADLMAAAWAYYYFSVQFRESLTFACQFHPDDEALRALRSEECNTSNLSPYEGVAAPGEKMDHDEFMRRTVTMLDLPAADGARLAASGLRYLEMTRALPAHARAMSIPTYEDGGLETVFRAILTAPDWSHASLQAFRHFLVEHIRFDSNIESGHGAMSRHLRPDGETALLWIAFRDLFIESVPAFDASVTQFRVKQEVA